MGWAWGSWWMCVNYGLFSEKSRTRDLRVTSARGYHIGEWQSHVLEGLAAASGLVGRCPMANSERDLGGEGRP